MNRWKDIERAREKDRMLEDMYKIEYKAKRKITIELNIFLPV